MHTYYICIMVVLNEIQWNIAGRIAIFFLAVDLTAGRVFSKKGDGNHKNGDIY